MRLSAFLEAWVQLVFAGGEPGRAQGNSIRIPQQGVTELITHHKVAAAPSQPQRHGQLPRLTTMGMAKPVSGSGPRGLVALLSKHE
jgi:hypothetical protein